MTRDSCSRSVLFALLVVGAGAWIPSSLHAAQARRSPATQTPATQTAESKKQERPSAGELLAQGERDRLEKERLEKERIQKERMERQRAESLRRTSGQGKPPGSAVGAEARKTPPPEREGPKRTIEERREVAKQAAHFESKYRSHVARINRLIGIYRAKGDDTRVTQLERMREKLDVRREHAMEGFRKDLGEHGFQQVQGQVNGKARRELEERAKAKKESPKEKLPGDVGGGQ